MDKEARLSKILLEQKNFLEEKLNDYINSIKQIKGEEYAEAIRYLSGAAHTSKMISVATKDAPEIIRQAVGMQFATSSAIGANLIFNLLKLGEKDIDEMIKWSDTIGESIDETLEAVHKKAKEINDDDNN